MNIIKTKIKDLYILEPVLFPDSRGWFMESYNASKLSEINPPNFIQDNHSYSKNKKIVRGLHFQTNPKSQTKLIRCTKGVIIDVVVDLRKDSPTYKEWLKIELSAENKKQLYIPKGFAHGFLTLTDEVEIQYKVDEYYSKENDRSIRWNDPEIGVDWGIINPILSEKDANAPFLKDSDVNF